MGTNYALHARGLAQMLFKGKTCKGGRPYFEHLERVANAVKHLGEDYECAAYLHDALEDCADIISVKDLELQYPAPVVQAVKLLTKSPYPFDYMVDYIVPIRENKIATAVKIADLTDNLNIARLPALHSSDFKRIEKYFNALCYLKLA